MITRKKKIEIAIRDLNNLKKKEPFLSESLDLAIDALEKEIPESKEFEGFTYVCGRCGEVNLLSLPNDKCCVSCGQRLVE
ncbi:MAG: hypothetical protein VB081_13835 [Christensenella sp.]|uniref:hypothetical protein n=1 Tax=Christensenella sp. TaxID=1935934 RepID=UPI002B2106C9|nr:hypothetical protein [Christensenella sp.]MEA5004562.1 hypothetical protein [Christensenella sp.]